MFAVGLFWMGLRGFLAIILFFARASMDCSPYDTALEVLMTMKSAQFNHVPFIHFSSIIALTLLLTLGACSDDGETGAEIEIGDTLNTGASGGASGDDDISEPDAGTTDGSTDDAGVEPECVTSLDCVIKNPGLGACQSPVCNSETSQCEILDKENCCEIDDDCASDDVCTKGTCPSPGGPCEYVAVESECTSNEQCPLENACQTATCSDECGGTCSYDTIEGCCVSAQDCQINDPCLQASCENSECSYKPVSGCCNTDAGCNDGNECTADSCVENKCLNENIEGCGAECAVDKDCDDAKACTKDTCEQGKCLIEDIEGCCTDDSGCESINDCAVGVCEPATNTCAIKVVSSDPACCDPDAANPCDDGNQCTADFCNEC